VYKTSCAPVPTVVQIPAMGLRSLIASTHVARDERREAASLCLAGSSRPGFSSTMGSGGGRVQLRPPRAVLNFLDSV
jgi:hypothetical protein